MKKTLLVKGKDISMNDNIDKYISLSEENLLDLIKNNQNEAFKFQAVKYYSRLLGYAIRFVQEKEIAEDIIQEVFISFWEKRHFLKSISLSSLLFCMVRNASINYLKQKVLVEKYPIEFIENIDGEEKLYTLDFALSADEETLYEDLKKRIQEALSVLPERSREIFLLSRFNGLKNKEIASKLDISTTAVEKHISKSLKKISSYLKDNVDYNDYIIIISIFLSAK